jgi:hypothetical protein
VNEIRKSDLLETAKWQKVVGILIIDAAIFAA